MSTAWRNRIVGSANVAPGELLANPNNWRTHPGPQRDALRGSLGRVGWVQQVIVNTVTGHLVDGHARIEEALSRDEPTVPVLYVELELDEEKLVLASLDPIGALAGTDEDRLRELLAEVQVDDESLRRMLGDLLKEPKVGKTDPDDVPDVSEEPYVKAGDLWLLGEHRLLCGDATKSEDVGRVMGDMQADCIWTDPPYGVDYVGKTRDGLQLRNDDLDSRGTRSLVASALTLAPLRKGGVFYLASPGGPLQLQFLLALAEAGLRHRQTIVWVKDRFVLGRSDFHYQHEPLLVGEAGEEKEHDDILYGWANGAAHLFSGGRRLSTVWEIKRPTASREHPTIKPAELVRRGIEYSTRAGDVVYDPFVGSGTTIIAAEQLARRCYAIDIDPKYVQVAIERWQGFTGQTAVNA